MTSLTLLIRALRADLGNLDFGLWQSEYHPENDMVPELGGCYPVCRYQAGSEMGLPVGCQRGKVSVRSTVSWSAALGGQEGHSSWTNYGHSMGTAVISLMGEGI